MRDLSGEARRERLIWRLTINQDQRIDRFHQRVISRIGCHPLRTQESLDACPPCHGSPLGSRKMHLILLLQLLQKRCQMRLFQRLRPQIAQRVRQVFHPPRSTRLRLLRHIAISLEEVGCPSGHFRHLLVRKGHRRPHESPHLAPSTHPLSVDFLRHRSRSRSARGVHGVIPFLEDRLERLRRLLQSRSVSHGPVTERQIRKMPYHGPMKPEILHHMQ